jgi:hypothetical protein
MAATLDGLVPEAEQTARRKILASGAVSPCPRARAITSISSRYRKPRNGDIEGSRTPDLVGKGAYVESDGFRGLMSRPGLLIVLLLSQLSVGVERHGAIR